MPNALEKRERVGGRWVGGARGDLRISTSVGVRCGEGLAVKLQECAKAKYRNLLKNGERNAGRVSLTFL